MKIKYIEDASLNNFDIVVKFNPLKSIQKRITIKSIKKKVMKPDIKLCADESIEFLREQNTENPDAIITTIETPKIFTNSETAMSGITVEKSNATEHYPIYVKKPVYKQTREEFEDKIDNFKINRVDMDTNERLITLLKSEILALNDNLENGKIWTSKFEDASTESQHEMDGYLWALGDVISLLNKFTKDNPIEIKEERL